MNRRVARARGLNMSRDSVFEEVHSACAPIFADKRSLVNTGY